VSTEPSSTPAAAEEHVLDATGHVHLTDAPIDLSVYSFEAWIAFAFFWLMGFNVCYQFFTRYFLNDSAAWTEEIARYLLICTVFTGIAAAIRDSRHIHVDFLYRIIPQRVGRAFSTFVDLVQIGFLSYAVVLTWQMMQKMGNYKMTIIDLPMNLIYGVCLVGFALSAGRAVQVAIQNWRRGYSVLDHPDSAPTPESTA
jgi:TRAP-type C4-dicarboxylate transport system permease small subunit